MDSTILKLSSLRSHKVSKFSAINSSENRGNIVLCSPTEITDFIISENKTSNLMIYLNNTNQFNLFSYCYKSPGFFHSKYDDQIFQYLEKKKTFVDQIFESESLKNSFDPNTSKQFSDKNKRNDCSLINSLDQKKIDCERYIPKVISMGLKNSLIVGGSDGSLNFFKYSPLEHSESILNSKSKIYGMFSGNSELNLLYSLKSFKSEIANLVLSEQAEKTLIYASDTSGSFKILSTKNDSIMSGFGHKSNIVQFKVKYKKQVNSIAVDDKFNSIFCLNLESRSNVKIFDITTNNNFSDFKFNNEKSINSLEFLHNGLLACGTDQSGIIIRDLRQKSTQIVFSYIPLNEMKNVLSIQSILQLSTNKFCIGTNKEIVDFLDFRKPSQSVKRFVLKSESGNISKMIRVRSNIFVSSDENMFQIDF